MSQDVQVNENFLCDIAAILNMTVKRHCFIEANANNALVLYSECPRFKTRYWWFRLGFFCGFS